MSGNTAGLHIFFDRIGAVSDCTNVVITIVSLAKPVSIILKGVCAPENTTTRMSKSDTICDYDLTFIFDVL